MDLTLSCANIWNGSGTKELMSGWAGDAISGCQFFVQKKRYFPAARELLRTWKREELPLQAPPLTGPIVFALMATALAWNLTNVAVLIAIGYGGFLRTMKALTLQRHQITAHGTCFLMTLPVTKEQTFSIQSRQLKQQVLLATLRTIQRLAPPSQLQTHERRSPKCWVAKRNLLCPFPRTAHFGQRPLLTLYLGWDNRAQAEQRFLSPQEAKAGRGELLPPAQDNADCVAERGQQPTMDVLDDSGG